MKITNIEIQKNNNKRVNIYVDDLFAIGIDEELKFKYNLEIGMEVDDNFIKQILKTEEQNKVTNQALHFLSFRQRSEKEIYDSLKRKGFEDIYIDKAIDYCKEKGYLNDKEFAKSFVSDKLNLSKLGVQRIRYELKLKGISQDIIDEVLIVDSEEQFNSALELAQKKFPSYKNDDRNGKYRKLSGFLQRKGYTYEIVSKVVREVLND